MQSEFLVKKSKEGRWRSVYTINPSIRNDALPDSKTTWFER